MFQRPQVGSAELLEACEKRGWGLPGRVGGDDRFSVNFLPSFVLKVISILFKEWTLILKKKKENIKIVGYMCSCFISFFLVMCSLQCEDCFWNK